LLAASGSFAAIRDNSKSPKPIRVVMDDNYPPYVFKDDKGQLKGITIDQWRLWEKKTGIHVEVSGMDWGEAQRKMQAGGFDVIDTIFRNEKRESIYDFTNHMHDLMCHFSFMKIFPEFGGRMILKAFL
jgi:two-component system cell cycle sensor histidine kinase/response regulator CckA